MFPYDAIFLSRAANGSLGACGRRASDGRLSMLPTWRLGSDIMFSILDIISWFFFCRSLTCSSKYFLSILSVSVSTLVVNSCFSRTSSSFLSLSPVSLTSYLNFLFLLISLSTKPVDMPHIRSKMSTKVLSAVNSFFKLSYASTSISFLFLDFMVR
jgi:hypothetical protein